MPTDTRSDSDLDWLSPWIYQSTGDVEAKQLGQDHSIARQATRQSCDSKGFVANVDTSNNYASSCCMD